MCIAIHKPYNVELPSEEVLENCFDNNPHGAGYMFADKGKVIIRKGFMTIDALLEALKVDSADYDLVAKDLALHFRITTSGGTRQSLTHPYSITNDYDDMRKLENKTDIGLIHNGVMSVTKGYTDKTNPEKSYNDTMEFISKYMFNVIDEDINWHSNERKMDIISNLLDTNKLVILQKDEQVIRFGDFIEKDGIYYSNTSYVKRVPVTYSNTYKTPSYFNNKYKSNTRNTSPETCGIESVMDFKLSNVTRSLLLTTELKNKVKEEFLYDKEIVNEFMYYLDNPYPIRGNDDPTFNEWYEILGKHIDVDNYESNELTDAYYVMMAVEGDETKYEDDYSVLDDGYNVFDELAKI